MLHLLSILLFGLATGSFLNACVYRLPRGISVVRPGSACPLCGHELRAWENVPVLSFVVLRGRCSSCAAPISWRYPLVELAVAAIFGMAFERLGATAAFVAASFFLTSMLALVLTDWDCRQLPDEITLGGLAVGVAWALGRGTTVRALLGAAVGGGALWLVGALYKLWRRREGMGWGDIKMMAMVGSFLGWIPTLVALILGTALAALVGVGLAVGLGFDRFWRWRHRGRSRGDSWRRARQSMALYLAQMALPFGVALGLMSALSWGYGLPLWNWYLRRVLGA